MLLQEYIPLIVTEVSTETADVKRISFTTASGELLPYLAGQFVSFALPVGNKEERRSYSFVSTPGVDTNMTIAVKRIDNGLFSRKLHDDIKPGDLLNGTGISGLFTLPESIESLHTLFFFAAGIGITPVLSLIKSALYLHRDIKVILFYSNSHIFNTAFYNDLNTIADQFQKRFQVQYLFSSSPQLSKARLNKELATELLKQHKAGLANSLYYVCGPYAYMRMVIYALEEMKVPSANIRKENFDTTITRFKPTPPDKKTYHVHLDFGHRDYYFTAGYPDTILQAAEKNGIQLPYSCRNGVCGSCAAHCTSGKVWHSANEVLTDKELESGMILTCVGYPVNGDITIEI